MMTLFGALFGAFPAIVAGIIGLIPAWLFGSITLSILIGIGVLGGIVVHFLRRTRD